MRREHILFRLTAIAAVATLAVPLQPIAAQAQPAPPQPAQAVNPPSRVGALTRMQGGVSFHAQGADSWSAATLNYPVTTGEGFWTQEGAEARIDVSDSDLVLAGGTQLEVGTLETMAMVASLPQGEAFLQIRNLQPGETYTLVTPRGSATFAAPGRYAVLAGDTGTPTLVTVLDGSATLGDGAQGTLTTGQAAQITGDAAPFQVQVVPTEHDAFIDHVLAEERPAPAQRAPAPPLVAQMPGGADLAEYGTWSSSPDYGQVWYPQVSSDWVPYREGQWSYVQPWGWTWVDSDPWGFAPFHYGRWAQIDGRWGWIPGYAQPVAAAPPYPVYAPALVTFFGVGLAAGVTAALLSRGSVGWVPLGPNEPYRPWFRAGPQYVRDVNIRHVTNITQITSITNNRNVTVNNVTINRFRNAAGATVVPAAAMATSRPIAAVARRPDPQVLAQARPVVGRAPIPPTRATAGVTPAVARSVHVLPAPAGAQPTGPAPGPAIRPQAAGSGAAGRVIRPPLHNAASAGAARPSAPPESTHAGAAVPALRPPGATPPAHPLTGPGAAPTTEAAHRPGAPTAGPPRAAAARPEINRPAAARPEAAPPEIARPEVARPELASPGARPTPHVVAPMRPEVSQPGHPGAPVGRAPAVPAPAARPEVHPPPTPMARPQPRQAAIPAVLPPRPQVHAAPQPAPRPEMHAATPRPVSRPQPPPAPRPTPQARPAPPPAPHPAPHPAPREEQRHG